MFCENLKKPLDHSKEITEVCTSTVHIVQTLRGNKEKEVKKTAIKFSF